MLLLLSVHMSACLSRLYTEHTVYPVLAICWLETSEWKYWHCGYIEEKGLAKGVHWQLRSCLWLAAWERGSTLRGFCTARRWVEEADYFPSSFSVLTRTKLSQGWRLWVVVQRGYCYDSSILWTAHLSVLINYCLLWNPIFVFLRVHLGLEIIRASCLPLLMPRSVPWWQFCFILK